ncbi:MAG: hypothetical protein NZ528_09740 [Caldilineales bacterium]|nr:hypothetical protein [Caldilineales bacterium]MDW8319117.1 hypothetical protein [Anaerolineae bacterium]
MNGQRVLIISKHPLFADAIAHVLSSEGIAVVGVAGDLPRAAELISEQRPSAIVVDCDDPSHPDPDLMGLMMASDTEAHLVLLSLDSNRMAVYQWHQVGHATSADLVSALSTSMQRINALRGAAD